MGNATQKIHSKRTWLLAYSLMVFMLLAIPTSLQAQGLFSGEAEKDSTQDLINRILENTQVTTSGVTSASRVAPGEFLPVSVELLNFGGVERVDVSVTYELFDSQGRLVLSEVETVAVETTANFVKELRIPSNASPGSYVARTSILYQGQLAPAVGQFDFTVERKILGLFTSQFLLYAGILIIFSIITFIAGRIFIKRLRISRIKPHDYSNIPKEDRLYYELIGDTIVQMRLRIGDEALLLARTIPELTIDDEGTVLEIKKNPAKIMSLLVLLYEKNLGKRVSFKRQKRAGETAGPKDSEHLERVNSNIEVVRKYFT